MINYHLRRYKHIFLICIIYSVIFVSCFCGCSNKNLSDNEDNPNEYKSVVALSKSIGDLWLLAGGELTGITEDGLELDNIKNAVSVGTLTKPSEEAIFALTPDLVLLSGELSSHLNLKEKLNSLGIQTMTININSFQDYSDIMKELTQITEHPEMYDRYVTELSKEIEDIKKSVPDDIEEKYLAIRVSATKNKVLKNDYFACDIFNDLGMKNIIDDSLELEDLNLEWIAGISPDYIFIVLQGEDEKAIDSLEVAFSSQPVWKELSAVKNGKVFILPKDMFQYKPNAKWADAYQYAYELIYE